MDQRYKTVRRKLDDLGYKQPLSIESMGLVEKLLADLSSEASNRKVSCSVRSIVEVLRGENSELHRDNSQLHQTLLKHLESSELASQELQQKIRKLQDEVNDYKFLNTHYVQKMKAVEKDNNDLAEKILKLQGKNAMAVVETRSHVVKKPGSAFRHQKMEIDSALSNGEGFNSRQCRLCGSATYVQVDDPYVANMLEVADKRISQLQEELELTKNYLEDCRCSNQNLKQQVESRDYEIERLSRQLESRELVIPEAAELDISKYLNKIEEMAAANEVLKQDYQMVLKNCQEAEHEVSHLRARNCKLEQEVYSLKNVVKHVRIDKDNVYGTDTFNSNSENNTMQCANERLQTEICQLESDKRTLNDKVNQLISNERRLQHENFNLRQLNLSTSGGREGKDSHWNGIYSESDMKLLELQRDYYMQKVEELGTELELYQSKKNDREAVVRQHLCGRRRQAIFPTSLPRPSRTKTIPKRRALTPPPRWQATRFKTRRNAKSRSPSPAEREVSCGACANNLQHITQKNKIRFSAAAEQCIKQVEEERDYYKLQYNNLCLKEMKKKPLAEREKEANLKLKNHQLNLDVEELRSSIRIYKDDKNQLQKEFRELRDSKERIERLYRESEGDQQKLENDRTFVQSLAERSSIRRIERENEEIARELHSAACEKDALRERLKVATEMQKVERSRLENVITSLENKIDEKSKECGNLTSYLASYKSLANQYEDQLRVLEVELAETNDKITQHKGMANHMKKLVEQTQQCLQDTERELAAKDSTGLEECILKLQRELDVLSSKSMKQITEIESLRRTMSSLDREKDQLQTEVDIRTERLASLDDTLRQKERIINDMKITVHTLEANLDRQREELISRDKEVKTVRRQCELTDRDLQATTAARDGLAQQLKTLQDDLMTMTRENQCLHADLDDALTGQKNLKEQMQDYVSEVSRVEALLKEKDRERLNLLEQFHNVTEEANSLESQNNQLECETATTRLELHAKNIEIQHLQNSVNTLQLEVEQSISAQQNLELELSQSKRAMSNFEVDRQTSLEQIETLREDLRSIKAVCSQLDASKEQLRSTLADKEADCERVILELADAQAQMKGLHGEIQEQFSKIRELEHLLSTNRHTEFQSQISMQEITAELRMAREQLVNAENRLLQSVEESTLMRTKAAEMEAEVERLRRQLTHERFEKERAEQELRRRHTLSPVPERRSYSTSIGDDVLTSRPKSHVLEYRVHHSDEFLDSLPLESGIPSSRLQSGEEEEQFQGGAKASSPIYSKWDQYKFESSEIAVSGSGVRSWQYPSPITHGRTSSLGLDIQHSLSRSQGEGSRIQSPSPGGLSEDLPRTPDGFVRQEDNRALHQEENKMRPPNGEQRISRDAQHLSPRHHSPSVSPVRHHPNT